MTKKRVFNIGDTDQNADWIKTPKNRESERRIHEEVMRQLEAEKRRKKGGTP